MSSTEKSIEATSTDHISLDPEKRPMGVTASDREGEHESLYLSGIRLYLIVLGLCLTVMLMGLDQSILSTAIPTITTAFNSLDEVGWYGSAYLICVCALQPLSGKLYQYFSLKWMYISFIVVFELGSLICALSNSSVMLILGRAIAGMGAAGLFSGALVIISHSIPLRQRPIYTGFIVSMLGASNIIGPILGGVFTQDLTWRWCFYINLPLGAVTIIILTLFFNPTDRSLNKLAFREKMQHLDLPGLLIFIPSIIMLLLAIQWGGSKHAWKSATVIGLIFGFAITMSIYALWQWHLQEEASITPRIVKQRNVYSAVWLSFFGLGAAQTMGYFLPIWFQVIKGLSPVESGIRFLPAVLGNLVMAVVAGALTTKFGHVNPWLFLGGILFAIAGGMFTTWKVDSGNAMINGIQVLAGFGCACVIQMPLIALMSILPESDLPTATSISVFFQFLGGAVFLVIGENIFVSRLVSALHTYAPSVDAQTVVAAGAEGLRRVVDGQQLPGAILAYNVAITKVFYLIVAGGVVAFFCAFGIEWKNVKEGPKRED